MEKNNTHFEPDYHKLNRKAKRSVQGVKSGQADTAMPDRELLERLSDQITEIKDSIDWEQDLSKASYVAFDTETTGLFPHQGDEIISIGAVTINNDRILSEPVFYQLVNPNRTISPQSQQITGINAEMLADKPPLIEVLPSFLEYTGPRILVAHNAPFDLAFINRKIAQAIDRRIVNPVIDTVLLTSALFYSFGDYSLESLASRFKLDLEGRHNALADARIAATLFIKLIPALEEKGVNNLHQLARFVSEINLTKGYPLVY